MKKNKLLLLCGCIFCVLSIAFVMVQNKGKAEEEIWGMADAKEININPKVSGRIIKICVNEGDTVKEGQVLAYLDRDTQQTERMQTQAALAVQLAQLEQTNLSAQNSKQVLEAAVQKAEADLALARNDEQRYAALLAQNAVSQQAYDTYASKLKTAQAAYASAKANLLQNDVNKSLLAMRQKQINEIQGKMAAVELSEKEAVIRAPFTGVINKKYLEEGSLISPTVPLFSLQDGSDNWVNFKVKETDLEKFSIGQKVQLRARNSKLCLQGTIVAISKKADYATIKATSERGEKDIVAFNVKVQTNDRRVWPGMRFSLEG